MYPVGIFLFIAVIDMFMTWYGVVEKGADYYKDIAALLIADFITVYLAIASVSGTVQVTSTTYLNDEGLMWLGILIALAQGIFIMFEIIEAVQAYRDQQREKLLS